MEDLAASDSGFQVVIQKLEVYTYTRLPPTRAAATKLSDMAL